MVKKIRPQFIFVLNCLIHDREKWFKKFTRREFYLKSVQIKLFLTNDVWEHRLIVSAFLQGGTTFMTSCLSGQICSFKNRLNLDRYVLKGHWMFFNK